MSASFLAMPDQLQAKVEEWSVLAGPRLHVEWLTAYSGHQVYGLTLTDPGVPRERKQAHYFAQPHAHEPGATAGMIDVIEQLVTGHTLEGRPTPLDVDRVLAQTLLTFNPIGNPQGRERAPVLYWDGSRYTNDEFWCWMRGEDPDRPGQMWKRLDIWDIRQERAPDPIGIVYEQVDAYTYVEPNRSQRSSYFQLFHRLDAQHHYRYWLDLHQTEFVDSPYHCKILLSLPGLIDGAVAAEDQSWGEAVVKAWQQAGYRPLPQPQSLGYTGEQAEYFRRNWGALHQRMNIISTEAQNNAPEATAAFQRDIQACAIQVSIERLLR